MTQRCGMARAEALRDEILRRAVTPEGWISATLDGAVLDASTLLLPGLGLLDANDPRFIATLDVTSQRLVRNGFVMRYVDEDDFGQPRSAFLVCTFWYIDALASVGRRAEALAMFENVLTTSQPSRHAVGGCRAGHRRTVGQLPADLFAGRTDLRRDASVAFMGGRSMARLVIVSNRLPLPSERGPRAGGLAVALADALRPGSLWFGWSGRRVETPADAPGLTQADGITYATVDMTEAEYRGFYVGFANGALWPLLHFRLGLMTYRREEYQGYRAVNRRFAAALASVLQPDDLIWVHDYHLIPLAQELRLLSVRNRIGFFLHIPFVPPVMLEVLPCATDLLEGLAAYDVVGFHTDAYRRSFLQCAQQMLGVELSPDSFTHNGSPCTPSSTRSGSIPKRLPRMRCARPVGRRRVGCATAWANAHW